VSEKGYKANSGGLLEARLQHRVRTLVTVTTLASASLGPRGARDRCGFTIYY
jgi:hypothetical protein